MSTMDCPSFCCLVERDFSHLRDVIGVPLCNNEMVCLDEVTKIVICDGSLSGGGERISLSQGDDRTRR